MAAVLIVPMFPISGNATVVAVWPALARPRAMSRSPFGVVTRKKSGRLMKGLPVRTVLALVVGLGWGPVLS